MQCSFSSYGSNKRYILQKIVSRIKVRISSIKKMDETPQPILTKLPAHIYDFVPPARQSQRRPKTFNSFSCRAEHFKNSFFFLEAISEWNNLNPEIRSSGCYNIFPKSQLNFIRPSASKIFNVNDTISIKLITRPSLGFSHLRERKFKHNF